MSHQAKVAKSIDIGALKALSIVFALAPFCFACVKAEARRQVPTPAVTSGAEGPALDSSLLEVQGLSILSSDSGEVVVASVATASAAFVVDALNQHLSIRPALSPSSLSAGSVVFDLDGSCPNGAGCAVQNTAPYDISGDSAGGKPNRWDPPAGQHSLTVTPYSGPNASGTAGVSFLITLDVLPLSVPTPTVTLTPAPRPTATLTPAPTSPPSAPVGVVLADAPPVLPACGSGTPGTFVAAPPLGSYPAAGTYADPLDTLAHAQTAAQGNKASKSIYLRGGSYSLASNITLTSKDDGETWSACAGDPPVIIDGAGSPDTDLAFFLDGVTGITFNGLTIKNFENGGISTFTDGAVYSPVTVENCELDSIAMDLPSKLTTDATVESSSWAYGAVVLMGDATKAKVYNNYVNGSGCGGIRIDTWVGVKGAVIANNIIMNTGHLDCGAVYIKDSSKFSVPAPGAAIPPPIAAITGNFIANFQTGPADVTNETAAAVGVYLDCAASGFEVYGNIIAPPATHPYNTYAFSIHGGGNNRIHDNLIDLGTSPTEPGLLVVGPCTQSNCNPGNVNGAMGPNQFENNTVYYSFNQTEEALDKSSAVCINCAKEGSGLLPPPSGSDFSDFSGDSSGAVLGGFPASNWFFNYDSGMNAGFGNSGAKAQLGTLKAGPHQGYSSPPVCPSAVSTTAYLANLPGCGGS